MLDTCTAGPSLGCTQEYCSPSNAGGLPTGRNFSSQSDFPKDTTKECSGQVGGRDSVDVFEYFYAAAVRGRAQFHVQYCEGDDLYVLGVILRSHPHEARSIALDGSLDVSISMVRVGSCSAEGCSDVQCCLTGCEDSQVCFVSTFILMWMTLPSHTRPGASLAPIFHSIGLSCLLCSAIFPDV